jgi:hypothetical protein
MSTIPVTTDWITVLLAQHRLVGNIASSTTAAVLWAQYVRLWIDAESVPAVTLLVAYVPITNATGTAFLVLVFTRVPADAIHAGEQLIRTFYAAAGTSAVLENRTDPPVGILSGLDARLAVTAVFVPCTLGPAPTVLAEEIAQALIVVFALRAHGSAALTTEAAWDQGEEDDEGSCVESRCDV